MGEGQIAEDYPKNKFRRYVVKPEDIDIEFHIGIRADDGAYVAAI